jgi:UDP-N-acetylglucosamine--N-acetylmuramyl-(pentapeptide) pyrophosphoryl-undecaprenol N-acetylglucosamine transferase
MKSQSICLLGGHLSPAQAVAECLKTYHPEYALFFIGRKQEFTSSRNPAVELTVMSNFGEVYAIDPPRRLLPWNWFSFFISFVSCFFMLMKRKPVYVISFGSYVSLPGIVAAKMLKIPIAVHEQTRSLSAANRFAADSAKVIAVVDNQVVTNDVHVIVTGFPYRESLFTPMLGAAFSVPSGIPLVFVGGGTTGAVAINELLFPVLKELLSHVIIIHQTGDTSFEKAQALKESLQVEQKDKYIPQVYISSESMNWIYSNISLMVSRSGANTVYELAAFDKRALFIPLPESKEHEQEQLAAWFSSHYDGAILLQATLTSERLRDEILKQVALPKKQHSDRLQTDGAKRFVDAIMNTL